MYERHHARTRKMLYAMARVITDQCPEIKDRCACRRHLRAAGFKDDAIKEWLPHVQHMARVLRGRDADRLVYEQVKRS